MVVFVKVFHSKSEEFRNGIQYYTKQLLLTIGYSKQKEKFYYHLHLKMHYRLKKQK